MRVFSALLGLIVLSISSLCLAKPDQVIQGPYGNPVSGVGNGRDSTRRTQAGKQGFFHLWVRMDQTYGGHANFPITRIPIASAGDLFELRLQTANGRAMLIWDWGKDVSGVDKLNIQMPDLPGPAWYQLYYMWDADKGIFTGYVNGTPLRLEGSKVQPWKMGTADKYTLYQSPLLISAPLLHNTCITYKRWERILPEEYRHNMDDRLGGAFKPTVDIANRKGNELYNFPLTDPSQTKDWIMEGPGQVNYDPQGMTMLSTLNADDGLSGHIVYWMPHDLPENFIAQWTMQPISEDGLCITFFAAKGVKGEDLFDPSLKKREGVFKQYIQSDINCYHFSYYANTPFNPGRITTNLRKNSGFHLVSNGAAGIQPGSTQPHQVMLMKDGGHIVVNVDGKTILDFTDDGKAYGSILDGGKIGLRQMRWMQARYRDLKIFSLK